MKYLVVRQLIGGGGNVAILYVALYVILSFLLYIAILYVVIFSTSCVIIVALKKDA